MDAEMSWWYGRCFWGGRCFPNGLGSDRDPHFTLDWGEDAGQTEMPVFTDLFPVGFARKFPKWGTQNPADLLNLLCSFEDEEEAALLWDPTMQEALSTGLIQPSSDWRWGLELQVLLSAPSLPPQTRAKIPAGKGFPCSIHQVLKLLWCSRVFFWPLMALDP